MQAAKTACIACVLWLLAVGVLLVLPRRWTMGAAYRRNPDREATNHQGGIAGFIARRVPPSISWCGGCNIDGDNGGERGGSLLGIGNDSGHWNSPEQILDRHAKLHRLMAWRCAVYDGAVQERAGGPRGAAAAS